MHDLADYYICVIGPLAIRTHHFLLVICSNNLSILHRFRYITTFTLSVTACDLKMSFSFNKTVEITGHVRSPVHVQLIVLYSRRYGS